MILFSIFFLLITYCFSVLYAIFCFSTQKKIWFLKNIVLSLSCKQFLKHLKTYKNETVQNYN